MEDVFLRTAKLRHCLAADLELFEAYRAVSLILHVRRVLLARPLVDVRLNAWYPSLSRGLVAYLVKVHDECSHQAVSLAIRLLLFVNFRQVAGAMRKILSLNDVSIALIHVDRRIKADARQTKDKRGVNE